MGSLDSSRKQTHGHLNANLRYPAVLELRGGCAQGAVSTGGN